MIIAIKYTNDPTQKNGETFSKRISLEYSQYIFLLQTKQRYLIGKKEVGLKNSRLNFKSVGNLVIRQ